MKEIAILRAFYDNYIYVIQQDADVMLVDPGQARERGYCIFH